MAQRHSGYAPIESEHYCTPSWVVDELLTVETFEGPVWEICPGEGHMVRALEKHGLWVCKNGGDFFDNEKPLSMAANIVTNPPFKDAHKFIRHALKLVEPARGKVAMLLPVAYDAGKTRRDLFLHGPIKAKYTLTKRIRWANLEQKEAGPSANHAWFVWDWSYQGSKTMGWLPL